MYSTGFLQAGVLRAVARLHIADILAHEQHNVRLAALSREPEEARAQFRGREQDYSLSDADLAIPLSVLAQKSCSNHEFLQRLLRAAQLMGVFKEIRRKVDPQAARNEHSSESYWIMTEMSNLLRWDHPRTVKAGIEMMGGEQYVAFSSLYLSVRSGQPAFSEIYGNFWDYHEAAQKEWDIFQYTPFADKPTTGCVPFIPQGAKDAKAVTLADRDGKRTPTFPFQLPPNQSFSVTEQGVEVPDKPRLNNVRVPMMFAADEFNQGMTAMASSAVSVVASELPFEGVDTVVDIAGGHGHLLREILRTKPHISTGILFDIPSVLRDPQVQDLISNKMLAMQKRRIETYPCSWSTCPVPGNLFSIRPDVKQPQSRLSAYECPRVKEIESSPGAVILRKMSDLSGSISNVISDSMVTISSLIHGDGGDGKGEMQLHKGRNLAQEMAEAERDAESLCPTVHVTEGSFFTPETIPRAHHYGLPALQHKYLMKVRREAMEKGLDSGSALVKSGAVENIRTKHTSAYVMMQILHDWSDEDSMTILKNLRLAMLSKIEAQPGENTSLCCSCGQSENTNCSQTTMMVCGNEYVWFVV